MIDPNQPYYGQQPGFNPGYPPPQQPGYPQAGFQPGFAPQPGYGQPGFPPQPAFQPGYPSGPQGYVPPQVPYGQVPPQPDYGGTGYIDAEDGSAKGFEFSDESIRKAFIRKVYMILCVS